MDPFNMQIPCIACQTCMFAWSKKMTPRGRIIQIRMAKKRHHAVAIGLKKIGAAREVLQGPFTMPIHWHDTDCLTVRTKLLPGLVLPVWQRREASVGALLFWEQRFWLERLQIRDKTSYRKQEHRRKYIETMTLEYGLEEWDTSYPRESTEAVATPAFSTRGLLTYILFKRMQTDTAQHAAVCAQWTECLVSFKHLLATETQSFEGHSLPQFTLQGVVVDVGSGGVADLTALSQQWHTLPEDYENLRTDRPNLRLLPWTPTNRVPLIDFLLYLDVRVQRTPGVDAHHWLSSARTAVLNVAAFLAEVLVLDELDDQQSRRPEEFPARLYGPSGTKQVYRAVAPRMALLRRLARTGGSPELVAKALVAGKKGMGSQIAGARNRVYVDATITACTGMTRLALGWDGSCHGGREVNLGYGTNIGTGVCFYLPPTAIPHKL